MSPITASISSPIRGPRDLSSIPWPTITCSIPKCIWKTDPFYFHLRPSPEVENRLHMSLFYLLKRLGLMALTLLCATFLTFVMLRMTPGDPAELILQKVFVGMEDYTADAGAKAVIEERFGLHQIRRSETLIKCLIHLA